LASPGRPKDLNAPVPIVAARRSSIWLQLGVIPSPFALRLPRGPLLPLLLQCHTIFREHTRHAYRSFFHCSAASRGSLLCDSKARLLPPCDSVLCNQAKLTGPRYLTRAATHRAWDPYRRAAQVSRRQRAGLQITRA
jgi:hypothetical protein